MACPSMDAAYHDGLEGTNLKATSEIYCTDLYSLTFDAILVLNWPDVGLSVKCIYLITFVFLIGGASKFIDV